MEINILKTIEIIQIDDIKDVPQTLKHPGELADCQDRPF